MPGEPTPKSGQVKKASTAPRGFCAPEDGGLAWRGLPGAALPGLPPSPTASAGGKPCGSSGKAALGALSQPGSADPAGCQGPALQDPFSPLPSTQETPSIATPPPGLTLLCRHRAAKAVAVPCEGQVDFLFERGVKCAKKMPLKLMLQSPACAPGGGGDRTWGERLPAPLPAHEKCPQYPSPCEGLPSSRKPCAPSSG